jgi:autotransporter-associated beta strand protein
VLKLFQLRACLIALSVVGLVDLLANRAQAVTHRYFDVNGTTAGSGVTNGTTYAWESSFWNSNDNSGTTATSGWTEGDFPRFAAGIFNFNPSLNTADAQGKSYSITANSNHTFAGMFVNQSAGGTVTINGPGILTLAAGDQGIFIGSPDDQILTINARIAGTGKFVWQGSGSVTGTAGILSLYGNNTFSGGLALNTNQRLNFNNDHSFGTNTITWGYSGGTAFAVAAPDATAPINIGNAMVTKSASSLTMSSFAQPVTWSGPWTLATGTSTLDVASGVNTTISSVISGTNGTSALAKTSPGTLILSGANTYGGGTTISGGTLELSGASTKLGTGNVTVTAAGSSLVFDSGVHSAIPDSATLNVTNSATMTLNSGVDDAIGNATTVKLATGGTINFGGAVNERIGALFLDTVQQPNGTYGSSQSNAVNKFDEYFSGTGILTVGPPILAGDYDNNGIVDAADYVIWRKNVGQPLQTLPNDTTGVIVGDAQYNLWRSNFGSTTAVPGSGSALTRNAVPEPSSIGLLMLGLTAMAVIRTFRGMNGLSQHSRRR